jgi:C-terminal processing protease CtpA/Prc
MPRELFEKYRGKAVREKELKEFAGVLKRMLDELDDLHVHLRVGGERVSSGPSGNPNPENWNLAAVDAHAAEILWQGKTTLVARLKEGVGYVRLASFGAEWDELKDADRAMDRLNGVRGWILDVRPNGGGGEDKGEFFAGRFVGESIPYAHHVFRDPFAPEDPGAFTAVGTRWLSPREDCVPDPRPVAVLMGPYCVSSTEGFLAMMAAVPQATLVGLPSRGASGNPATFKVVPGLELVSSRWRSLTLEDACIEGVGLQPDVAVEARPPEYQKGDPTFERALKLFE